MSRPPAAARPDGDACCVRCYKLVGRHGVRTHMGVMCEKHADRLPPYLRRAAP